MHVYYTHTHTDRHIRLVFLLRLSPSSVLTHTAALHSCAEVHFFWKNQQYHRRKISSRSLHQIPSSSVSLSVNTVSRSLPSEDCHLCSLFALFKDRIQSETIVGVDGSWTSFTQYKTHTLAHNSPLHWLRQTVAAHLLTHTLHPNQSLQFVSVSQCLSSAPSTAAPAVFYSIFSAFLASKQKCCRSFCWCCYWCWCCKLQIS